LEHGSKNRKKTWPRRYGLLKEEVAVLATSGQKEDRRDEDDYFSRPAQAHISRYF
jgi:hypothetical protein